MQEKVSEQDNTIAVKESVQKERGRMLERVCVHMRAKKSKSVSERVRQKESKCESF